MYMYWIYEKIIEIIDKYLDYNTHYLVWDELGPI